MHYDSVLAAPTHSTHSVGLAAPTHSTHSVGLAAPTHSTHSVGLAAPTHSTHSVGLAVPTHSTHSVGLAAPTHSTHSVGLAVWSNVGGGPVRHRLHMHGAPFTPTHAHPLHPHQHTLRQGHLDAHPEHIKGTFHTSQLHQLATQNSPLT